MPEGRKERLRSKALITALLALFSAATAGAAEEPPPSDPQPAWTRYLDNEYYKVSLNLRARVEVAEQDGLDTSQAWTVRTRLGVLAKPIHGFSGFVEGANMFTFDSSIYWDVVSTPNGKTPIADPPYTALNRLWGQYENPAWLDLKVKAGRQWIILDDSRWVGNVGWRQNDQTFESARVSSSFGLEGLEASYAYIWDVRRIFDDKGPPANHDWDSQSSILHASYDRLPGGAALTGFAYLLDFDNSPGNSSNTWGVRVTGDCELGTDLTFGYAGSLALQTDAGDNPVSYEATYVAAEGRLGYAPAGALTLGYELLGSDDGKKQVVTPLATAHKFNGFADVFLDNGGPGGLQDLYVTLAPRLPWQLKGFLTYHHFWSDEKGTSLGDEVDFVLTRGFGKYVTASAKGAYFAGRSAGPPNTWRYWLEATLAY
jgi:hypothetical protein